MSDLEVVQAAPSVLVSSQGRAIAHLIVPSSYVRDDKHFSHSALSLCSRAVLASTSDPAPLGPHETMATVPAHVHRCKQCFQTRSRAANEPPYDYEVTR